MQVDLSDVVDAFADTAVTRRRYAAGTLASTGVYTPGASTDTTVYASLTVPDPRTLEMLSEGQRSRARWLMHTTYDVRTSSDASQVLADKVIFDGVTYEPVQVRAYTKQGNFRRLVLVEDV